MDPTPSLADLGGNEDLNHTLAPGEQLARVAVVHRGSLDAIGIDGVHRLHAATRTLTTGDWVAHDGERVLRTLPRTTLLSRQSASNAVENQLIAANVDIAFLVTSMNRDFNPQRLIRLHAAVAQPGLDVVVVLTKADLDLAGQGRYLRELDGSMPGVEVLVTSTLIDLGIDALRARIGRGRTGVLFGTSGVGKSSLVNALLGASTQLVHAQREGDDRGRHTTVRRELLLLDGGGALIDSPGVRSIILWDGRGIDVAFGDLHALAESCRFRDCGHDEEPGCAVQAAVASGELSPARLKAWAKLEREVVYQEGRKDRAARRAEHRAFAKKVRAAKKDRWS